MKEIPLNIAIENDFSALKKIEAKSIVIDEFFLDAMILQCKDSRELFNNKIYIVYAPGIWKKLKAKEVKKNVKVVSLDEYQKFKDFNKIKLDKRLLFYSDINSIIVDVPMSEIVKIVNVKSHG